MMPRLSQPSKKQKIGMLDRRWSKFVRDHGRCENCGVRIGLTDSHIIDRSYMKTRFDPRNNQCLCGSCHGSFESQPTAFARWIESTTCGQYVDNMLIQANDRQAKPDYDLWLTILETAQTRQYDLEQTRQWLGQNILLYIEDLSKLD